MVRCRMVPLWLALMLTFVGELTDATVMAKVAFLANLAIETLVGTLTTAGFELSSTHGSTSTALDDSSISASCAVPPKTRFAAKFSLAN